MENVTYRGLSGHTYAFKLVPIGAPVPETPGLYVAVSKAPVPNNALGAPRPSGLFALGALLVTTRALYFGRTGDLADRLFENLEWHHKVPEAVLRGATHFGILTWYRDADSLRAAEVDLIKGNPGTLNDRAG